jgi:O-antigen/teichoic acid export membrane protein
LGGLVGQALAPVLGPWILGVPQADFYFSITMVTFMCSFPIEIGLALMRAQNRPSYYAAASLFRLFSGVVLNVITIVVLRMGVLGMLISALITSLLLVLYMTWYVLKGVSFRVDLHTARKLVRYSLPLLISGFAIFLINSADRLVLRHFVSLDEVGLYALAYRLGMLVSYVYTPIELYWSSQMFLALKHSDGHTGYARAATYVMLILTVVTLGLSIFARPALAIAVPTFQASAKYVPWVALACLIRAVAAFCRSAIYVEGKTRLEARVTVISAMACVAGYALLIPRFGSWGAIAATFIGVGSLLVLGQWFAQSLRSINFEYRRIAQIAICATVVVLLNSAAAANTVATQFAVGIVLLMAFPGLLAFSGFFNEEERRRISAGL